MNIEKRIFGEIKGVKVYKYTLLNSNGISVSITNYGGIVTDLIVPDSGGNRRNIVLGFVNLSSYEEDREYLGALIGRFANRIKGGIFTLDGKDYRLACNENGKNHIHGGIKGFNRVLWEAEPAERPSGSDQGKITGSAKMPGNGGVSLKYLSKDGEEGYPGNLSVKVVYSLNDDNEFKIEYTAETDKPTPVNLTNHTYWNLSGRGSEKIYNHTVKLNCPQYLEIDEDLVPTGRIRPVENTPMDFMRSRRIGDGINKVVGGYDHCYILKPYTGKLTEIAEVQSPLSGVSMQVFTTMPGVQFYSGNFLHGAFDKHDAFCLETQFYPDCPNRPEFPDCILKPGQVYSHATIYRFQAK
ncbi:MAG: galactose-1-epimerase [Spirochaetes bacterium]|nr:MAG: galactose-1-epimerase [Spirochaetota bacterium]